MLPPALIQSKICLFACEVLRCKNAQVIARTLDVPVPPTMSLPITELQRRAEELEFSELLDQVCSFIPHTQSPQLERLKAFSAE